MLEAILLPIGNNNNIVYLPRINYEETRVISPYQEPNESQKRNLDG